MPEQASSAAPVLPAAHRAWWQRLSWLLVLVAGVGFYLLVLRTLVATENINFFPSLLLLGSITVPASVLVFAWDTGRPPAVSARIVAITAVCGGIVGTLAAGTLEYDALRRLGTLPMLAVGIIEELAKMVVPAIILLIVRRPRPGAGLIIGVASGMGFATLETMGYGFTALIQAKSLAAVDTTLLLRALLAPAGHVAWTGMTVAALWNIPIAVHKGRATTLAVAALVLAVVLHTAWDGSSNLVVHISVVVLSFVTLLVLIHRSHRIPGTRRRRHGGVGLATNQPPSAESR